MPRPVEKSADWGRARYRDADTIRKPQGVRERIHVRHAEGSQGTDAGGRCEHLVRKKDPWVTDQTATVRSGSRKDAEGEEHVLQHVVVSAYRPIAQPGISTQRIEVQNPPRSSSNQFEQSARNPHEPEPPSAPLSQGRNRQICAGRRRVDPDPPRRKFRKGPMGNYLVDIEGRSKLADQERGK